ncbi:MULTISPECIES: hypothetical protein [unclassified Pseudoclavibacter]|uniref:hypothetical protein n=1 Tax=unclassified Pseudoclavibacter TaxID=2615177 RepID=UPI0011B042B7|nr:MULTISPECIES: hypothetical protein [unclassified Pseudoclavibacter]
MIAATVAVPLSSASQGACAVEAVLVPSNQPGNSVTLLTNVPGVTVSVATETGPDTVTEQQGQNFNFTTGGSGWNGQQEGLDVVFHNFSPLGAIVLNQRGTSQGNSPRQDVRFTAMRNGAPISVSEMNITIYDVSAALETLGSQPWRPSYRDAVGFSLTPSATSTLTTSISGDPGTGAGTYQDPFRRASGNADTSGGPFAERFEFASVSTDGLGMRYTSFGGLSGWQFIAISGISFNICV